MTTNKDLQPKCECGSVAWGLVWIPAENRYQCGTCIHATYARVAKLERLETVKDSAWLVNRAAISLQKQKTKAAMEALFRSIETMARTLAESEPPQ